jgi:MoaA/NifB/PqqE/SkfB family radical SAM enzyme
MNLLGEYQNGNYKVSIYDDGTKIRETDANEFTSRFPECMDIKITNYCDMGCAYCHENSSVNGLHGDILSPKFIDTLYPYTELAIGGGNPLSHPDIISFLEMLKSKNIIANMTVNQTHFTFNNLLINDLVNTGLIKGLGISLNNSKDKEFIEKLKKIPNAVLHVINGVVKIEDLERLYDSDFKILIFGYKQFRRGNDYYSPIVEENKAKLYEELPNIIKKFQVVSFDNLAIKQLDVKRLMSNKDWNEFYMGDDGQFTMYVDLVNKEFARSSTSTKRYKLMNDIVDMFNVVKSE